METRSSPSVVRFTRWHSSQSCHVCAHVWVCAQPSGEGPVPSRREPWLDQYLQTALLVNITLKMWQKSCLIQELRYCPMKIPLNFCFWNLGGEFCRSVENGLVLPRSAEPESHLPKHCTIKMGFQEQIYLICTKTQTVFTVRQGRLWGVYGHSLLTEYCCWIVDETNLPADIPSYLSSQGTLADRQDGYISSESGSHHQFVTSSGGGFFLPQHDSNGKCLQWTWTLVILKQFDGRLKYSINFHKKLIHSYI